MRIVGLNIRHGGRNRIDGIVKALDDYGSDIVVLGEYRANASGRRIQEKVQDIGLKYFVEGKTENKNGNTVAICSKIPFEISELSNNLGTHSHRIIEAVFDGFKLVGVYFPNKELKRPVFEYLMGYCERNINETVAILGDFNTGKHYIDMNDKGVLCAEYIDRIEELGWVDGWRKFHGDKREYSWYSTAKNGFRIDHAFCTPSFSQELVKTEYDHHVREKGITDHSALILDILIKNKY